MIKMEVDFRPFLSVFKDKLSPNKIKQAEKRARAKVVLEIRKDVRKKTPRDKGDLDNSWRQEFSDNDYIAGFDIVYAMYQHEGQREDGTHIIRNRPAGGETWFLQTTIDENIEKYVALFEKEVLNYLGL